MRGLALQCVRPAFPLSLSFVCNGWKTNSTPLLLPPKHHPKTDTKYIYPLTISCCSSSSCTRLPASLLLGCSTTENQANLRRIHVSHVSRLGSARPYLFTHFPVHPHTITHPSLSTHTFHVYTPLSRDPSCHTHVRRRSISTLHTHTRISIGSAIAYRLRSN